MVFPTQKMKPFIWKLWIMGFLGILLLLGCSPTENPAIFASSTPRNSSTAVLVSENPPTPSGTATSRYSAITPRETKIQTSIAPSDTPEESKSTAIMDTPEPFDVEIYNPGDLFEGVQPDSYITETCRYLELRWDPEKSQPGTIVAPIMFHSVRQPGRPITDATSISEEYFQNILAHAKELGFETITSAELVAFLKENESIPSRSMIMILDDRRPGVTERFIPYLEANDWTLTLGWIIEDQRDYLWEWMEELASGGRLDIQSHGYWHRYMVEETPEEIIQEEIYNPIPIIEDHFGTRPIIFIWPGGNFTAQAIQIAHDAGFELAFTAYAHGPLMFNWIPQTDKENTIGDPLMTLPRFWSTTAWLDLEKTARIGEEAHLDAIQKFPSEADWYRKNCGGELHPPSEIELTSGK